MPKDSSRIERVKETEKLEIEDFVYDVEEERDRELKKENAEHLDVKNYIEGVCLLDAFGVNLNETGKNTIFVLNSHGPLSHHGA